MEIGDIEPQDDGKFMIYLGDDEYYTADQNTIEIMRLIIQRTKNGKHERRV